MTTLYFDIETGPLPADERTWGAPNKHTVALGNTKDPAKIEAKVAEAVKAWEEGDKCALDAKTGEVLLIGYAKDDQPVEFLEGAESRILADFWRLCDPSIGEVVTMVGHNVLSFDLPFIIRRSWVNGIAVSPRISSDIQTYRPASVVDTMREWGLGDRHCMTKLDHLIGVFGLPKYTGPVTGARFSEWFEKDQEAAKEYCRCDVEATRRVAKAMGLA
jgi:hypothetical protein